MGHPWAPQHLSPAGHRVSPMSPRTPGVSPDTHRGCLPPPGKFWGTPRWGLCCGRRSWGPSCPPRPSATSRAPASLPSRWARGTLGALGWGHSGCCGGTGMGTLWALLWHWDWHCGGIRTVPGQGVAGDSVPRCPHCWCPHAHAVSPAVPGEGGGGCGAGAAAQRGHVARGCHQPGHGGGTGHARHRGMATPRARPCPPGWPVGTLQGPEGLAVAVSPHPWWPCPHSCCGRTWTEPPR